MIKVIQVGDLHFDNTNDYQNIKVYKRFIEDLVSNNSVDENTILVINGDLINMGGKGFGGVDQGLRTFKIKFIDRVLEQFPILKNRLFIVPGNHDIDRKLVDKFVFTSNIDRCKEDKEYKEEFFNEFSTRESIIKHFTSYKKFKNMCFSSYDDWINNDYYDNMIINLGSRKVGITCANSALFCVGHNDKDHLLLGRKQIENSINQLEDCDYRIFICHHYLYYLNEIERSDVEGLVNYNYHLALFGHVHEDKTSLTDFGKHKIFESTCKTLKYDTEGSLKYSCGYKIIEFDGIKYSVNVRLFNSSTFSFYDSTDDQTPTGKKEFFINTEGVVLRKTEINVSNIFKDFLNDIGANFTNQSSTRINLEDLFVVPNIEKIGLQDEEQNQSVQMDFDIVLNDYGFNSHNMCLIGEDLSGKTTLCKVIYKRINKIKDNCVVYLDFEELTKKESLQQFIERQYRNQYDCEFYEVFDTYKIYLIIDNLYKNEALVTSHSKEFNELFSRYNYCIVWDELVTFQELFINQLIDLSVYKILSLDDNKRKQLILKWYDLTKDLITGENYKSAVYSAIKLVNSILGKNLVPSYPLFILTILQANELSITHELKEGTIGHYYDVLIKTSMNQKGGTKEIDKYYSYLSEFCGYLYFVNKNQLITEDEIMKFHIEYKKVYGVELSFTTAINFLLETEILVKENSFFKLKYQYLYFYFLGKYFSDNFESKVYTFDNQEIDIDSEVKILTGKLYESEAANIILFLTHHNKSKKIIDFILESADEIFKENTIIDFKDNNYRNLNEKIEQLTSTTDNVKEIKGSKNEVFDSIGFISNVNKSFKIIEILGNILKHRYASFRQDDKVRMIKTIYNLGNRNISAIHDLIFEDKNNFEQKILDVIDVNNHLSVYDRNHIAQKILFNLIYLTSSSIISKICYSIATKELEPAFETIKAEKTTQYGELLFLGNYLEYTPTVPIKQIDILIKDFGRYSLGYRILRKLVISYLRIYEQNDSEKQKIDGLLMIGMQNQRYLQKSSKQMKKKHSKR
ncbi:MULTISPECIES: metallophosphoesterase [unclassified Myroides]|uniref:metallophosphoesterase family protein n=1 Tax=unclassified Myroides TaxID=2642485 RepID=UPI003D2F5D7E